MTLLLWILVATNTIFRFLLESDFKTCQVKLSYTVPPFSYFKHWIWSCSKISALVKNLEKIREKVFIYARVVSFLPAALPQLNCSKAAGKKFMKLISWVFLNNFDKCRTHSLKSTLWWLLPHKRTKQQRYFAYHTNSFSSCIPNFSVNSLPKTISFLINYYQSLHIYKMNSNSL